MADKKLSLTASERLSIPVICPDKDNIDRLLIRKGILAKTEITPDEAKEMDITQQGTNIFWKKEINPIEVELAEVEMNYLRNCITELSNKKELSANMVELYQKIKG